MPPATRCRKIVTMRSRSPSEKEHFVRKTEMMRVRLSLLAGCLLCCATLAHAEKPRACFEDTERLCPDVKHWDAHVACLLEHEGELSEACKARTMKIQARAKRDRALQKVRQECSDDIASYCSDIPETARRHVIMRCLKGHRPSLSKSCSQAIQAGGPTGGGKAMGEGMRVKKRQAQRRDDSDR